MSVQTSARSQCPLDLRRITPPGRVGWPLALGCAFVASVLVAFLVPRPFVWFCWLFGQLAVIAFSYVRASRMARGVDLFDEAVEDGWLQAVAREVGGQFVSQSSAPVVLTIAAGRVTITGRTVEEWPAAAIGLGGLPSCWSLGMKLMTPEGIRHLSFVAAGDLAMYGRAVVDRRAYGAVQRVLLANQSRPRTDAP